MLLIRYQLLVKEVINISSNPIELNSEVSITSGEGEYCRSPKTSTGVGFEPTTFGLQRSTN